jgi:hypothetical protein
MERGRQIAETSRKLNNWYTWDLCSSGILHVISQKSAGLINIMAEAWNQLIHIVWDTDKGLFLLWLRIWSESLHTRNTCPSMHWRNYTELIIKKQSDLIPGSSILLLVLYFHFLYQWYDLHSILEHACLKICWHNFMTLYSVFLLFPWTWQLHHRESLHPHGHQVTAAMLVRATVRGTLYIQCECSMSSNY